VTPVSSLLGARIRRIDAPEPDLLALTLFSPQLRACLLFRISQQRAGVGLSERRPHGQAATSFVQKLRKELENARIVQLTEPEPFTLALVLVRSETEFTLTCDFAHAQFRLQQGTRTLITADTGDKPKLSAVIWPEDLDTLYAQGERLLSDRSVDHVERRRTELDRALRTAQKRLERRMSALDEDRARAAQAQPLRERANLLLAYERQVKRGQTSIQVIDYTRDPPAPREIALDPTRTLREQIDAWFKQARRYERGAAFAEQRQQATHAEIEQLAQLRAQLPEAQEEEALELIAERARNLGVRGVSRAASTTSIKRPTRTKARKPYREFRAHGQRSVLVGRGAADNDVLTREHARPHDLWLHARGTSGAHVVIALKRDEACPQELLLDASHLAAHFSSAHDETQVEVSYTPKRYVRKPRNAPAGLVQLEREKVIVLRIEPARITRLLASEVLD